MMLKPLYKPVGKRDIPGRNNHRFEHKSHLRRCSVLISPNPATGPPKPHLFVKTGRNEEKFGTGEGRSNSETGRGGPTQGGLNLTFLPKRSITVLNSLLFSQMWTILRGLSLLRGTWAGGADQQ